MRKAATEQEELRQAKARRRRIQHYEQVTHNVSQTCRFFGISRVKLQLNGSVSSESSSANVQETA